MRVVAAAGAALVFTTRSNFICRSQFWHFHSNVPRGIFVVTFLVMICDALYGCSATCWIVPQLAPQFCTCPVLFCRSNFVQFCTNFRLAAFLHKSIFLRTRLHISARGAHKKLNAPQWTGVEGEQVCTGVEGAHFDVQAVRLHCSHVHGIATLMWTILCVFVQMIVHPSWPPMCTCTQCVHHTCSLQCDFNVNNPVSIHENDCAPWLTINVHMCTMCTSHMYTMCTSHNVYIIALRFLCAPLPWWTIC